MTWILTSIKRGGKKVLIGSFYMKCNYYQERKKVNEMAHLTLKHF